MLPRGMSKILYHPRPSRKKSQKRSQKKVWSVGVALLIGVPVIVFITVAQVPYFQIHEIMIAGNGTDHDIHDIREQSERLLTRRYWLVVPRRFISTFNTEQFSSELLSALPRLEYIAVKKQFPDAITIMFIPRTFLGVLCNDTLYPDSPSCGYIDRTGFLYESAPEASGSLILKIHTDFAHVKVGTTALDETTIQQMIFFNEEVPRRTGLRISAYGLKSQVPDELRFAVTDGFEVIINKNDDPSAAVRLLSTVLTEEIKNRREKLDYIDLRFGNKVFYRLKQN